MINKIELRVGNLLVYRKMGEGKGMLHEITCGTFGSFPIHANEYDPVPLSPEILDACGFEKSLDKPYADQDAWSIGTEARRFIFSANRFFKLTSNSHYLVIVTNEIKYLHTLQNAVFVLMGTELNVNLDKVKI